MLASALKRTSSLPWWVCFGFVLIASYFTYFHNFHQPQAVFWDENYHIASAQKYLNGIFFMEQHPPLGKLLIALGEKFLNRNPGDSGFIGTDYAANFPEGFSFTGYRFFPALLGWLTAPILFFVFWLLTRSSLLGALFSSLYVFDNALIVHLRGAMLEGPLIFFVALTVLFFLLLFRHQEFPQHFLTCSLWFGIAFALVMTTKLLGLILVLLFPALLVALYPDWGKIRRFLAIAGTGFTITYISIWQVHFALGSTINPVLPDQGFYQASEEHKQILASRRNTSLLAFPVLLRDSWKFVTHYNRGTPRLNLCKSEENGSPFYFWPFGARTISYRWETPDSYNYKYLYLQSNPVVWFAGLLGVVLGCALLLGSVLFDFHPSLRQRLLLAIFIGLWLSFMIAVSRIDRVLYLYHYFIPLLISFICFSTVMMELPRIGRFALTVERRALGLLMLCTLIVASYQFYRPLTYYEPISDRPFALRNLFSLWGLRCVRCEQKSGLVAPVN